MVQKKHRDWLGRKTSWHQSINQSFIYLLFKTSRAYFSMLHCCCCIVMELKHASIALTASYWVFAYPKINDEKIQRRATKLVISVRKLPYKERLLRLNLHTLKWRLRGDMIKVFKIVHNVYDNRVAPSLSYYNMCYQW